MGKATIISEYGAAKYQIRVEYDTTRTQAEIATLTAEKADLDAAIPGYETAYTQAQLDVATAWDALNTGITNELPHEQLLRLEKNVLLAQQATIPSKARLEGAKARRLSIEQRITFLNLHVPTTGPTVDAWCADLTLGLTGEVGTVEIARRIDGTTRARSALTGLPPTEPLYLIRPGGFAGDESVYTPLRDGILQPTLSHTPGAAFYNYALNPGASKWRPRYRAGLVVDQYATTVDVEVDLTLVAAALLNVNQAVTLLSVPIDYMGVSDVALFPVGTEVLVEFRNDSGQFPGVGGNRESWDNPVVIGYLHDPQSTEFKIIGPDPLTHASQYQIVGGVPFYDAAADQYYFGVSIFNDDRTSFSPGPTSPPNTVKLERISYDWLAETSHRLDNRIDPQIVWLNQNGRSFQVDWHVDNDGPTDLASGWDPHTGRPFQGRIVATDSESAQATLDLRIRTALVNWNGAWEGPWDTTPFPWPTEGSLQVGTTPTQTLREWCQSFLSGYELIFWSPDPEDPDLDVNQSGAVQGENGARGWAFLPGQDRPTYWFDIHKYYSGAGYSVNTYWNPKPNVTPGYAQDAWAGWWVALITIDWET